MMKLEAMETEVKTETQAKSGIDPALMAAIQDGIAAGTRGAIDASLNGARTMIDQALKSVEQRLATVEAPPRMIARIDMGERKHDLAAGTEISEQSMSVINEIIQNGRDGLNTMLVGPAGCGKTTMAALAAKILDCPFGMISWTAGMSETPSLFARWDGQKYVEAQWSQLYSQRAVFCHDEMDRADPNALCKINAGTANGHFYNEVLCEMKMRHPEFVIVATCNTVGRGGDAVYAGANGLDASTLDRFVKVMVDYDTVYESRICPDKGIYKLLTKARANLKALQASEIISTRTLQQVYLTHKRGKSLQACIASVTAGWSQDLVKQVGLDQASVEKIADAKEDAANALGSKSSESVKGRGQEISAAVGKAEISDDNTKAKIAANEERLEELKRQLRERGGR